MVEVMMSKIPETPETTKIHETPEKALHIDIPLLFSTHFLIYKTSCSIDIV